MKNITTTIKGNKLNIEIDLGADTKLSASGKSRIVATTHGNVDVENEVLPGLKLGLNCYVPTNTDG